MVERVGFLGRGESGVLANGPRSARVHGRPGAADKGRQTGKRIEVLPTHEIFSGIQRLDLDAFRRLPDQLIQRSVPALLAGEFAPFFESVPGKVRHRIIRALFGKVKP